jgi:hypothetical protein
VGKVYFDAGPGAVLVTTGAASGVAGTLGAVVTRAAAGGGSIAGGVGVVAVTVGGAGVAGVAVAVNGAGGVITIGVDCDAGAGAVGAATGATGATAGAALLGIGMAGASGAVGGIIPGGNNGACIALKRGMLLPRFMPGKPELPLFQPMLGMLGPLFQPIFGMEGPLFQNGMEEPLFQPGVLPHAGPLFQPILDMGFQEGLLPLLNPIGPLPHDWLLPQFILGFMSKLSKPQPPACAVLAMLAKIMLATMCFIGLLLLFLKMVALNAQQAG